MEIITLQRGRTGKPGHNLPPAEKTGYIRGVTFRPGRIELIGHDGITCGLAINYRGKRIVFMRTSGFEKYKMASDGNRRTQRQAEPTNGEIRQFICDAEKHAKKEPRLRYFLDQNQKWL